MPYKSKPRNSSMVDMLAKVPVHRGSLITSIDNLLKTIEISESAVMIPTLLRDKCEFDAWELLFVAKILKASILGHSDLVEFYMNHMGHSAAFTAANEQQQQQSQSQDKQSYQQHQQLASLSPSMMRNLSSPVSLPGQATTLSEAYAINTSQPPPAASPKCGSPASGSSAAGPVTASSNGGKSQSSSSATTVAATASWASAASQLQSASSSFGSALSGESSSAPQSELNLSVGQTEQLTVEPPVPNPNSNEPLAAVAAAASATSGPNQRPTQLSLAPSSSQRQAQPPSLLQLTTTNNHINSLAAAASNNNCNGNSNNSNNNNNNTIDQLTSQLISLQANGHLSSSGVPPPLSISTCGQQRSPGCQSPAIGTASTATAAAATPTQSSLQALPVPAQQSDMRSSRSAGCLFRLNSGASSPRTPHSQTPTWPQAETLANGHLLAPNVALSGDPSAPVKLLLQIEQLKSSIGHVTSLLESVVELYKKSVDNIAPVA